MNVIPTAAGGLVAAAWGLVVAAGGLMSTSDGLIIDVDVAGNGRVVQGAVLIEKSNANHAHAEGLCVEDVVDGRGS